MWVSPFPSLPRFPPRSVFLGFLSETVRQELENKRLRASSGNTTNATQDVQDFQEKDTFLYTPTRGTKDETSLSLSLSF